MSKTDIAVNELVNKVHRGELVLPEMQRRYVWPATRVRDLLDSLYKGYPSGTILVWETEEEIVTRELAIRSTKTPSTSQKLLLLDGQQRITSLASILSGQPVHVRNRSKPIDILFNLEHPEGFETDATEVGETEIPPEYEDMDAEAEAEEETESPRTFEEGARVKYRKYYGTVLQVIDDKRVLVLWDEDELPEDNEKRRLTLLGENGEEIEEEEAEDSAIQEELKKKTFVVASRALKNDPLWVPVSDIFNKKEKEILKPLGINSDDERWEKYSDRLDKVRKIQEYMYVMQVLEKNMSYDEVTEIFVRVNSLGIKLRSSDLALAQITSKWKGFMSIIEDFAEEFKDNGDYIVETGLPIRMLVIFATNQSKFKTVGKISKAKLESSWELATKGLRFAVNFLRSNAGIDDLYLLSSSFLLIPIAVYAILHDEKLTVEEEKALLKWFYYAHMRGHYGMGSSESLLDRDVSILFNKKSIAELNSQLFAHVRKFEVEDNDLAHKGIRSPFFSMLYFIL
ncbi:MAG: DUF262 domain-containing protein, partial [Candidatus Nanoarchaeia archaeon]